VLVTAVFAAAGGWVGAQTQFSHEQETNRDRARAVARLLIGDFDAATINLCDIGTRGSWFVSFVPLHSQVSAEDRRLLAQEMKDDLEAWQIAERADNRLVTWDAVQRGVVGEYVDPIGWGFKLILKRVENARRALEPMAGYDDDENQFRESCPQQDRRNGAARRSPAKCRRDSAQRPPRGSHPVPSSARRGADSILAGLSPDRYQGYSPMRLAAR
jgi:hypothetical protein